MVKLIILRVSVDASMQIIYINMQRK